MELKNIWRVLWKRRLVLLIAVVVAAGAALPLTLSGQNKYTSEADVFVPSTPPLPKLNPVVTQTLMANMMKSYVDTELAEDIRAELGDAANEIESIDARQSTDFNTYVIAVESLDPQVAQDGAEIGGQKIIDQGNAIADGLVDDLNESVQQQLGPIEESLTTLTEQRDKKSAKLDSMNRQGQTLAAELNTARQALVRAEAIVDTAQIDVLEAQIDEVEASIDELTPRISDLSSEVAGLSSDITLTQAQRQSLTAIVQDAEGTRLSRETASSVLQPASEPASNELRSIILIEVIALLVGLVVGAAVVLFIDRRQLRKGRHAG